MKHSLQLSIQQELEEHIKDLIQDGTLTLDNTDDWHFHAFNEDDYIMYHSEAEKWLARHNISAFEAIGEIQEYEQFRFGEVITNFSSPASVVNMYVYILGEEYLQKHQEELEDELTNLVEAEIDGELE